MQSAPVITDLTNKKPTGIKHSNFLITINSNIKTTSSAQADAIAGMMRDIINGTGEMFSRENFPLMLKFLVPGGNPSQIDKTELSFGLEVGKKEKRPHAHINLRIQHHTRIHLDHSYIKTFFTEELNKRLVAAGMPKLKGSVYVNIRHTGNHTANAEEYIKKTAL